MGLTLKEISHKFKDIEFTYKTQKAVDITEISTLSEAFDNDYDYCINCAAYTNVEEAEKHPDKAFDINAKGVKNLSEVCKNHQITLIHISTDYVFDGEKKAHILLMTNQILLTNMENLN